MQLITLAKKEPRTSLQVRFGPRKMTIPGGPKVSERSKTYRGFDMYFLAHAGTELEVLTLLRVLKADLCGNFGLAAQLHGAADWEGEAWK